MLRARRALRVPAGGSRPAPLPLTLLEYDKRGFTLTLPQSKDLVDENGEPRLIAAHLLRKRDAGRT